MRERKIYFPYFLKIVNLLKPLTTVTASQFDMTPNSVQVSTVPKLLIIDRDPLFVYSFPDWFAAFWNIQYFFFKF